MREGGGERGCLGEDGEEEEEIGERGCVEDGGRGREGDGRKRKKWR